MNTSNELQDRYSSDPDFILGCYGHPRLETLLAEQDVIGVGCLIVLPALRPESITTVVYTASTVQVQYVKGATQLWSSFASETVFDFEGKGVELPPSPKFRSQDAQRRSATAKLSAIRLHEDLCTWDCLVEAARGAPTCDGIRRDADGNLTFNEDGTYYWHFVEGHDVLRAHWFSPDPIEHAQHIRLLVGYDAISSSAYLFPECRVQRKRERELRLRKRKSNRK